MWPTTERRYIVARSWTCDPPKHSMTLNSEDRTIDIVDPRQLRRHETTPWGAMSRSCPLVTALLLPHSSSRAIWRHKNGRFHWRSLGAIISGLLIIMIERRHLAVNARRMNFLVAWWLIFGLRGGIIRLQSYVHYAAKPRDRTGILNDHSMEKQLGQALIIKWTSGLGS